MPARVLVYCAKELDGITPAMVMAELAFVDLMTLAEVLDLPEGEEAAVHEMERHLRFEGTSLSGGNIHWHATLRPIQISAGPPLPGEIAETLEDLARSRSAGAKRVRAHLERTKAILELEMGLDGSNHLAATISEVVAFFVAERADGLVWFYHREFASPEDRGAALWKTGP